MSPADRVFPSSHDAPLTLGLRELSGLLRSRKLSPVEVLEAVADAYEAGPSQFRPFLAVDFDMAKDAAIKLTEAGCRDKTTPLFGVPMSIKDLEPTRDFPTTDGARAVGPARERVDGLFAERVRNAGCVIFAKTNTPAFGHKDTTDNLLAAATTNPWDSSKTPGGSSGGAAVVVASGLGPVAHGTDAAGSVRMPAALCGVVGFKPSYGRIPRLPNNDLWAARGHHGILARTVDDVVVMMDAVAGGDERDPLSISAKEWTDVPRRPRRGRIAYLRSFFDQDVDAQLAETIEQSLTKIERAGIPIERPELSWPDPFPWISQVTALGAHSRFGELSAVSPELFDDTHLAIIRAGADVSAEDVTAAHGARTRLYGSAVDFMSRYDFILTPTLPLTAWPIDVAHPLINGRETERAPGGRWSDVLLANLLGWPAISIPCGLSAGLPVGLQIMAPWHADAACLTFAADLEQILMFRELPPPNPTRAFR